MRGPRLNGALRVIHQLYGHTSARWVKCPALVNDREAVRPE